jgi:hypothetical protein
MKNERMNGKAPSQLLESSDHIHIYGKDVVGKSQRARHCKRRLYLAIRHIKV